MSQQAVTPTDPSAQLGRAATSIQQLFQRQPRPHNHIVKPYGSQEVAFLLDGIKGGRACAGCSTRQGAGTARGKQQ